LTPGTFRASISRRSVAGSVGRIGGAEIAQLARIERFVGRPGDRGKAVASRQPPRRPAGPSRRNLGRPASSRMRPERPVRSRSRVRGDEDAPGGGRFATAAAGPVLPLGEATTVVMYPVCERVYAYWPGPGCGSAGCDRATVAACRSTSAAAGSTQPCRRGGGSAGRPPAPGRRGPPRREGADAAAVPPATRRHLLLLEPLHQGAARRLAASGAGPRKPGTELPQQLDLVHHDLPPPGFVGHLHLPDRPPQFADPPRARQSRERTVPTGISSAVAISG